MSKFYTYARHYGDKILYRGISDKGKRFSRKIDFSPTLYVKAKEDTKYKSIYGEQVSPITFGGPKEAADFIEQYKEVSNFPIFGQSHWGYQYLSQEYPGEVDWNINQIGIYSIDIDYNREWFS